jgi:hypothetical protein
MIKLIFLGISVSQGTAFTGFGILAGASLFPFLRRQHFHLFLFGALDSPLLHFRVRGYLSVGERPMEKEDVYAQQEHCQAHEYDSSEKRFHCMKTI